MNAVLYSLKNVSKRVYFKNSNTVTFYMTNSFVHRKIFYKKIYKSCIFSIF